MSQTYPFMRGGAPLFVALASGPLIGEGLSPGRRLGVAPISGGVYGMAFIRPVATRRPWAAPVLAPVNAGVIATYTITDGLGDRRSGAPIAYAFWTFLLNAIPLAIWATLGQKRRFLAYAFAQQRVIVLGRAGTLISYFCALWAMSVAPMAVIASLRETSILYATARSALVLKERVMPARRVSTTLIVVGAMVVRSL